MKRFHNLQTGSICSAIIACFCFLLTGCEDSSQVVVGGKSDAKGAIPAMSTQLVLIPNAMANRTDSAELFENREAYAAIQENEFCNALQQPLSTFAIDVDTASYANVRRLIRQGIRPPQGAVRLEELVNYFPYEYAVPDENIPFSVTNELAPCPWNDKHLLLRVGLRGRPSPVESRKPCNLVFLIDVSGSMQSPDKLPLVKSSLKLLTQQLHSEDRIALVVYAGQSGLVLDSTPVNDVRRIEKAIDAIEAGGSTNGGAGIQLAYSVAQANRIEGGINRVLLCTDGDFNVGVTSESELVRLIQSEAEKKIYLSVLGFGQGNLQDSTMEKLADKGNGNYAYIDSILEARKVLVSQVGGTLETIAKDVKIQLDFNPRYVDSYRLLGYENRKLENQDFRNDKKDAGEIGSDHRVTAFYEIVPVGQPSPLDNERKSEFVSVKSNETADQKTMLTVNLRYKDPDNEEVTEFQVRVSGKWGTNAPSQDFQFASSVLAYGMLLRSSQYAGNADWDWVVTTASKNMGDDRDGLRSEFVQLAKAASKLTR